MTKQATTNVAVEQKQPSKMELARDLFAEVFAKGYNLDGKSQRQVFITRAINEIGLSKAGANTYFQNLSNESRGEPLYKYNKYESKKPEADTPVEQAPVAEKKPTKAAVKKADAEAQSTAVDLTKRYQILNHKKQVVHSFATKRAADKYASQSDKLEVQDSKKAG